MNDLVRALGPVVAKEVGPLIAKEGINYLSQKATSPSHDLATAAGTNDTATIKALLEKDPYINRTPALVTAATQGRLNVLDLLLAIPASTRSHSRHSRSSTTTTEDFRKDCLDKWANGTNPLLAAITNKHRKTAKLLLEAGADPDLCFKNRDSPLQAAARAGSLDIVRVLLTFNVNVEHRDGAGDTALIIASRTGHAHTAHCLLQNGANIEAKNLKGATALLVAARHNHIDVLKMLLRMGADINARDKKGLGVLHRAVEGVWLIGQVSSSAKERTVRFLLDKGADPKARDLSGKTAAQKVGWKEGGARLRKLLNGTGVESPPPSRHGSNHGSRHRDRGHEDRYARSRTF